MNIWLVVIVAQLVFVVAQLVATVVANIVERGEDPRFAGAKVGFRS